MGQHLQIHYGLSKYVNNLTRSPTPHFAPSASAITAVYIDRQIRQSREEEKTKQKRQNKLKEEEEVKDVEREDEERKKGKKKEGIELGSMSC